MMEIKNLIRGWRRSYSGDGVLLSIPNGTIFVRPGVTPMRSADAIWRPLVPASANVEGPFGIVTSEGEYGVIVNAIAPNEQITIAILYGDHSYATIHARTPDPALREQFLDVVRRLADSFPLGLGVERRRRYFYEPPSGWTGIARPFSTLWLAPDCGRHRALLHVYHARPQRSTAPTLVFRTMFEQLSREFGTAPPTEPETLHNRFGLAGQLVTSRGLVGDTPTLVSDAGFTDSRMLYLVRLETDADVHARHLPTFRECLQTVQPIPAPKTDVDVLIEWFAAT